jgi:cytochrome c oxidase cbb3-type subunit 3
MRTILHALSHRGGLLAVMTILPRLLHAESPATAAMPEVEVYSPYSDPIFYGLFAIVLVLLIFILQLQRVFASVARDYSRGKIGKGGNTLQAIVLILGFSTLPGTTFAAEEQASFLKHAFGSNAINALFFLAVVELVVVLYYVRLIRSFTDAPYQEKPYVETLRARPSFWDRFNKSVTVEKEAAIMTDHDYDGIRELDNALPPWWKYGFYLTIVWSLVYLVHYHVAGSGPSSQEEYQTQVDEGQAQVAAYLAKMGNMVDETNVTLLTDAADLAKGREIYTALCVACHGASGEGGVGPNMTDQYWKHGGDIKDLFKTVKYGVSGTGMKSWKSDISPAQMAAVSSYILSLQGTNPPNGKAPEGTLYVPAADSLSAPADSLTVPSNPADTTRMAGLISGK